MVYGPLHPQLTRFSPLYHRFCALERVEWRSSYYGQKLRIDVHVHMAAHLHFRMVPEYVGNFAPDAPNAVLHEGRVFS